MQCLDIGLDRLIREQRRRVAAAFELPPPSPAPMGIVFCKRIAYGVSMEASRLKISAARITKFDGSSLSAGSLEINDVRSAGSISTKSYKPTGSIQVANS